MSEAPLLYKLQVTDLEIEDVTRSLADVEAQIGETDQLKAARARVGDLNERIHALEKSLRGAEWDVEDISSKLKPLDTKLYSGSVRNPKDLDNLRKEVEHLKRSKDGAESKALELMEELDELQRTMQRSRLELDAIQTEWEGQQRRLQDERDAILARLQQLNEARGSIVATVNPASLHSYDDLRRTRRGRAVAKVEQNTCQGCRVSIPMHEVQRARNNPELSFCSHCGRILWVGR